jgi:hypothetical protein
MNLAACFAQKLHKKTEWKLCEETRKSARGWRDNLQQPKEEGTNHLEQQDRSSQVEEEQHAAIDVQ